MENILTAIILVVGSIILYWMYLSASKEEKKKPVVVSNKPFLNVQLQDVYEEEEDQESKKYVPPVNSFIQSVQELGLDFSEDLTDDKVNEAYLLSVKRYLMYLESNQESPFMISHKEAAKTYLSNFIKVKKK